MKNEHQDDDSLAAWLATADRAIQREKMIRRLGFVPAPESHARRAEARACINRIVKWETSPRTTHGEWLARKGLRFAAPGTLRGQRLNRELWRLIEALALAWVFLADTNHLSDVELYGRLWDEVLPEDCPDCARSREEGCHWGFAPAVTETGTWLTYYASDEERDNYLANSHPGTQLPPRRRAPFRRDHRLPRWE